MLTRGQILDSLDAQPSEPRINQLRAWLASEDTHLASTIDAKVDVSEAQRLWSTRLKNTDITGKHLEGARELLHTLQRLMPQSELEQFAFKSPERIGIFFLSSSQQFVGAVLVNR